ncbi:MAG: glucosaminidase domain-containing protein [Bacteroidales bacterium]|nr:glucosaminidase domain-containing protein [Bacteroidales bacterium]
MKLNVILFVFLAGFIPVHAYAQLSKITPGEYISEYKDLAIKEMERTGIPASITLAQGILESGCGNSRLALKANNHFGIKCHDWNGKKLRHDDDARKECFRKYESVEESYRDHSDFLVSKSRYASLFLLDPDDYRQWAVGLRKAGYATSPTYAEALIRIIEENKLYLLDQGVEVPDHTIHYAGNLKPGPVKNSIQSKRKIFENNRVKYIIAKKGDSYFSITEELDLLPWVLTKYNETSGNRPVSEGQVLYIQPKRAKAEAGKKIHVVKSGETMYSISQKYAVRLDKLYHRNLVEKGTEPRAGTELLLRGSVKGNRMPYHIIAKDESEIEEEMHFEFDLE